MNKIEKLVIVFVGGVLGLYISYTYFFKDGASELSAPLYKCIYEKDYICTLNLAYENPPAVRPNKHKLNAANGLALLGQTQRAIEIFENDDLGEYHYSLGGAIAAYYYINDSETVLNGFLETIDDELTRLKVIMNIDNHLYNANIGTRNGINLMALKYFENMHNMIVTKEGWVYVINSISFPTGHPIINHVAKIKNSALRNDIVNLINKPSDTGLPFMRHGVISKYILNENKIGLTKSFRKYLVHERKNRTDNMNLINLVQKYKYSNYVKAKNQSAIKVIGNSIIGLIDYSEKKACISEILHKVVGLYAKSGNLAEAKKVLKFSKNYLPNKNYRVYEEFRCSAGSYIDNLIVEKQINDSHELTNYIKNTILKNIENEDLTSIRASLALGMMESGSYINEDARRTFYGLKMLLRSIGSKGRYDISYYAEEIKYAIRNGSFGLALEIAQDALRNHPQFNDYSNPKFQNTIRDEILPALSSKVSSGWLYNSGQAAW